MTAKRKKTFRFSFDFVNKKKALSDFFLLRFHQISKRREADLKRNSKRL